jgi:hypothetical protein
MSFADKVARMLVNSNRKLCVGDILIADDSKNYIYFTTGKEYTVVKNDENVYGIQPSPRHTFFPFDTLSKNHIQNFWTITYRYSDNHDMCEQSVYFTRK